MILNVSVLVHGKEHKYRGSNPKLLWRITYLGYLCFSVIKWEEVERGCQSLYEITAGPCTGTNNQTEDEL